MSYYETRIRQRELLPMLYTTLQQQKDLYKSNITSQQKMESFLGFGKQQDPDMIVAFVVANPMMNMKQVQQYLRNQPTQILSQVEVEQSQQRLNTPNALDGTQLLDDLMTIK